MSSPRNASDQKRSQKRQYACVWRAEYWTNNPITTLKKTTCHTATTFSEKPTRGGRGVNSFRNYTRVLGGGLLERSVE